MRPKNVNRIKHCVHYLTCIFSISDVMPASNCIEVKRQFFIGYCNICHYSFSNCMAIQDSDDTKIRNLAKLFKQSLCMGNDVTVALLAACSYTSFPFAEENKDMQTVFLLDLFSYLVNENPAEKCLLEALLPLYQSIPVWVVDLSNGKISVLLQILKICQGKTRVELKDKKGSDEGCRDLLQCLPYVSQLR